jgi:hypothetical protein
VRTRRGARLLVAGAVLTVAGIMLPSGVIQVFGMLVLLRGVAVALGVSERHRRPGGEPAAGVDVGGFKTPPWWEARTTAEHGRGLGPAYGAQRDGYQRQGELAG